MWPPLPPIPWGAGSPFFLYPASSPSPNNLFSQTSTCSKPSPSHLTIQSMSTLQRCFFKNPFWKSENLASHRKPGPAWSFSFWPSCWLRSAHTTLPAFAKVANIHFYLYSYFQPHVGGVCDPGDNQTCGPAGWSQSLIWSSGQEHSSTIVGSKRGQDLN